MSLRMWTYDLAREQCPTIDHLREICRISLEGGYDALGLYLEHRFEYPSARWAAGAMALKPTIVKQLRSEFPALRLIPFANLLGHFEGFLYSEEGSELGEERFSGMQACPSDESFLRLAKGMLDDVIEAFDDEIVHIGGDETAQLGECPACRERMRKWESEGEIDGKARIYGEHFGPLARYVLEQGRRPAVWGDMLLEHPEACSLLPKQTLVFDWQYFGSCLETSSKLLGEGFDVIGCPTLQTYNAPWFHLLESEENVRTIDSDVRKLGAAGVCVTTWEMGLFGAYDTLFPAIVGACKILNGETGGFLDAYGPEGSGYRRWAEKVAISLQQCGPLFAHSTTRSSLKARFLLYSNPFLLLMRLREHIVGENAAEALTILNEALIDAPNEACKGVTIFIRSALEFVLIADAARAEYAAGKPERAVTRLALLRQLFDTLVNVARRTHERIGGSLADIERCLAAKEHVERVIVRIRKYGDRSLGYLPSFETLAHPKFVPHDQANWWLINKWANE